MFGNRAYFRVSSKPAVLSIAGVQKHDAGMYTCRVDFRQSPTVYHQIALEVISKLSCLPFQSIMNFIFKKKLAFTYKHLFVTSWTFYKLEMLIVGNLEKDKI